MKTSKRTLLRGPWGRSWPFSGHLWGKRCRRTWDTNLMLWKVVELMSEHSQARNRTQDWLKKNPLGVVGEEGLASQLTWLQPFGLFCVWRLSVTGQCKASQQNWGPDPEDEGGDDVPWQGHQGEDLLEVKVQNQGGCHCWLPFHCIIWFSICSSAHFFLV